MTASFIVIIPARLGSTRLPEKMLLEIAGKPLLQHVHLAASRSHAEKVIIATDDRRIADCAAAFGAECIMTSDVHTSGTERLAEAVDMLAVADDAIIVNLQGDEIGMPPALIDQVAGLLAGHPAEQMATLCEAITDRNQIEDPNVVKVVFDRNNAALYFSRAPIPWHRAGTPQNSFRHIGLYAYRAGFLREFTRMPESAIERVESLEQLRALYHGATILVAEARVASGIGIDTEADLQRARELFS